MIYIGYHQQHIRWMKIWVLLLGGVKWSLTIQIVFVYQLNVRWLSALQSISREIWCSIVELVHYIWCIILHTTVKCQNNNCNNFHWEEKIQENLVLNTEVQFDYFQGTKYLHRYSIQICSLKFTSYRVRSHESECILVNYSQSRAPKLEVWIAVLFWIYLSWAQKSL